MKNINFYHQHKWNICIKIILILIFGCNKGTLNFDFNSDQIQYIIKDEYANLKKTSGNFVQKDDLLNVFDSLITTNNAYSKYAKNKKFTLVSTTDGSVLLIPFQNHKVLHNVMNEILKTKTLERKFKNAAIYEIMANEHSLKVSCSENILMISMSNLALEYTLENDVFKKTKNSDFACMLPDIKIQGDGKRQLIINTITTQDETCILEGFQNTHSQSKNQEKSNQIITDFLKIVPQDFTKIAWQTEHLSLNLEKDIQLPINALSTISIPNVAGDNVNEIYCFQMTDWYKNKSKFDGWLKGNSPSEKQNYLGFTLYKISKNSAISVSNTLFKKELNEPICFNIGKLFCVTDSINVAKSLIDDFLNGKIMESSEVMKYDDWQNFNKFEYYNNTMNSNLIFNSSKVFLGNQGAKVKIILLDDSSDLRNKLNLVTSVVLDSGVKKVASAYTGQQYLQLALLENNDLICMDNFGKTIWKITNLKNIIDIQPIVIKNVNYWIANSKKEIYILDQKGHFFDKPIISASEIISPISIKELRWNEEPTLFYHTISNKLVAQQLFAGNSISNFPVILPTASKHKPQIMLNEGNFIIGGLMNDGQLYFYDLNKQNLKILNVKLNAINYVTVDNSELMPRWIVSNSKGECIFVNQKLEFFKRQFYVGNNTNVKLKCENIIGDERFDYVIANNNYLALYHYKGLELEKASSYIFSKQEVVETKNYNYQIEAWNNGIYTYLDQNWNKLFVFEKSKILNPFQPLEASLLNTPIVQTDMIYLPCFIKNKYVLYSIAKIKR